MTSNDKSQKPQRIYNKDRIQRIKEAAEQSKQNDPNWYHNAPESLVLDNEDDMPNTRSKTPPFLKEITPSVNTYDNVPKRLTVQELTQCTKDSSQLANAMSGDNSRKFANRDFDTQSNHLEQSRRNKKMERDEANRKVADSLDKAAERWQMHMKDLNKRSTTQDSSGVKLSLFNDDPDLLEKYEKEKSEKGQGRRRFGTDFADRLDILLQRGLRTPWLSKSVTNIRSLNERSHFRWTNRLDRFSSSWDLKYSLLDNNFNPNASTNYSSPPQEYPTTRQDSFPVSATTYPPFVNTNAPQQSIANPFNHPQNIPNVSVNQRYMTNPNPQYPMGVPSYQDQLTQQYSPINLNYTYQNQYPNNPYVNQCLLTPQAFQAACSNVYQTPNYNQGFYQDPNTSFMIHPQNYIPPPVNYQYQCKPVDQSNTNSNSANIDLSNSFECVSSRISDLAEKLDKLNSAVDKLTLTQTVTAAKIKPIIKNKISSSQSTISKCVMKDTNDIKIGNGPQLLQRSCNCETCNANSLLSHLLPSDRRVRFAMNDELKDCDYKVLKEESCQVENENVERVNFSETHNYKNADSAHPQSVGKRYYINLEKDNDSKAYTLPSQVSSTLLSNGKRNGHNSERDRT